MISSESNGHPVEGLAAEFVERRRRGERPTIEEYAENHPGLAAEIRELFPTIAALEDVRWQQEPPPNGRHPKSQKKLTRLGDFRIVREIGRGGMGIVYEAVQESLRRRVAVKVLARHSQLDESHRKRFLREARTAGRLHHTNIVPILGVGEQDGFDFYVMQYIDGIGLDTVISRLRDADVRNRASVRLSSFWQAHCPPPKSATLTKVMPRPNLLQEVSEAGQESPGPPPESAESDSGSEATGGTQPMRQLCETYWQDVALVGLQVSEALEYAHSQGTLHRDIKPANLLIDGHGTTWVADFGLAKGFEHEVVSRTGEVMGTLQYMAPEQWRGKTDSRSDIYSLGVTLYELLTLRVPCQIHDRMKAIGPSGAQPTIVAPRKICPSLPADLETIVMTAIADEPEHRYQRAGDLAADLARFLEDRPISVRRPSLWERWSRWRRRNPAAATLSVIATALAALVAVVLSLAYVQTRAALKRESEANRETEAALGRVSAANDEAKAALGRELTERQRAEKTLSTALATLDNVFRHLVPAQFGEKRTLALRGDEKTASIGSQPVVSPETAALLEDLRGVYDQLGSAGGTSVSLSLEAAHATRRLGDIYARLGNLERAEAAYRQALDRYQSLQNRKSTAELTLQIGRVHNDLGAIYARKGNIAKSHSENRLALAMLASDSAPSASADRRFELARTYFLLGRGPDRQSDPGHAGDDRQPPPPPPREFERRRPGHRPPPAPPPREERPQQLPGSPGLAGPDASGPRLDKDGLENLRRAVAILEELVRQDAKNPAYRYLLAQCYREETGDQDGMGPDPGPLPQIDKAAQLLKDLVRDYPSVADYRFELADTYALLDVRMVPPDAFPEAERRLRAALEQSADLVDGHPYAPDYMALHIHILHKLARILREDVPDGPDRNGARQDEAGQLYQEAVRRQAALVKRFPENAGYRFWLARIRASSAEFHLERRRPSEAQAILEAGIQETERFYQAHPTDPSVREALGDLYAHLGEACEHSDDDQKARAAYEKAAKLGAARRPPPRGGGPPPDGHHPPPRRRGRGGPPPGPPDD